MGLSVLKLCDMATPRFTRIKSWFAMLINCVVRAKLYYSRCQFYFVYILQQEGCIKVIDMTVGKKEKNAESQDQRFCEQTQYVHSFSVNVYLICELLVCLCYV